MVSTFLDTTQVPYCQKTKEKKKLERCQIELTVTIIIDTTLKDS